MAKCLDELCKAEEDSGMMVADRAKIAGTFELVDIEATIEHAEDIGTYIEHVHVTKIDKLRVGMADSRKNGVKTGNPFEILKADLDEILAQYEAWTEHINCAVCTVQLFNVEKRFTFFEQDSRAIRYQAEPWVGEIQEHNPPTLRQMFKDPTNVKGALEEPEKPKERKARDIKAILGDRKRFSKLAVKDTEAIKKRVSDQETKLPSLPANVTYDGVRIPAAIPQAIRQSAYDLSFICDEIHEMRGELLRLRESIRFILMIWVTTSKEAWEYGEEHIHEFPDMRKYEYIRISLQVSYLIAFREEFKIFEYFQSEDRPKGLCPQLEATFVKFGRDPEKLQAGWDERAKTLTDAFMPVDQMLKEVGPLHATIEEEITKANQWWKSLLRPQSEK